MTTSSAAWPPTISQGSTIEMLKAHPWNLDLKPGPYWGSYDQLKNSGSTAFEKIGPNCVGTVNTKSGVYRILRDSDFAMLVGLAADVHRIKTGVRFVASAARVVRKHRDQESIDLLAESVALLGESPVLPERDGHGVFEISPEEAEENKESIDSIVINRPDLSK